MNKNNRTLQDIEDKHCRTMELYRISTMENSIFVLRIPAHKYAYSFNRVYERKHKDIHSVVKVLGYCTRVLYPSTVLEYFL